MSSQLLANQPCVSRSASGANFGSSSTNSSALPNARPRSSPSTVSASAQTCQHAICATSNDWHSSAAVDNRSVASRILRRLTKLLPRLRAPYGVLAFISQEISADFNASSHLSSSPSTSDAQLNTQLSLVSSESWVFSCASDVLGLEDRWDEALKSAEISWEMNARTPYGARSLGNSLVNLRRIREATERLSTAAEECQSFEVAQMACWHVCALAETVEGEERGRALGRAEELVEELPKLAPLADRETQGWFARSWLDIAELKDDHAGMERWANEVRSPFHRKLLENLRKNPQGLRIGRASCRERV